MIAVDTSSLSAYLAGDPGDDVEIIEQALADWQAVLPPVVLTELMSSPKLPPSAANVLRQLPLLSIIDGYWERAGALRAKVLAKKLKARLADALIAQMCIDHDIALISRDHDFRHYTGRAGLKLLP